MRIEEPGCIDCAESVLSAARRIRRTGLPCLVVTETNEAGPTPLGVISAQDIVTRVLAVNLDARVVTVGDVLTTKAAPPLDALLRRLS